MTPNCPRCLSPRQTNKPELFTCGSSDHWQSHECESLVDRFELNAALRAVMRAATLSEAVRIAAGATDLTDESIDRWVASR